MYGHNTGPNNGCGEAAWLAEWNAVLALRPTNKSAQLYIRVVNDENGPRAGSALPHVLPGKHRRDAA